MRNQWVSCLSLFWHSFLVHGGKNVTDGGGGGISETVGVILYSLILNTAYTGITEVGFDRFKHSISVLEEHTKGFKRNVVNWTLPSLHGVSLEITLTK